MDSFLRARSRARRRRSCAPAEVRDLETIVGKALAVIPSLTLPGGFPLIGDISPDCPPEHLAGLMDCSNTAGWLELLEPRDRQKLLDLMKDVPAEKRTARFMCAICLAKPNEVLAETEGKCEGTITEEEIGENGFGYDPVFFAPNLSKTLAQASGEEKNSFF